MIEAMACTGDDPVIVLSSAADAGGAGDAGTGPVADADSGAADAVDCTTFRDVAQDPDAGAADGWVFTSSPKDSGTAVTTGGQTEVSALPGAVAYYRLEVPDRATVTRLRIHGALTTNGIGGADVAVAGVYVRDGDRAAGHVDLARQASVPFAGFAADASFAYDHLLDGNDDAFVDNKAATFDLVFEGSWSAGNMGPAVGLSFDGIQGNPADSGGLPPFPVSNERAYLDVIAGIAQPVATSTPKVTLASVVVEVCRRKSASTQ